MGGAQVYKQAVENVDLDGMYITKIHKEYDCDTFFPEIPEKFDESVSLGGVEDDDVSYEYLFYGKN